MWASSMGIISKSGFKVLLVTTTYYITKLTNYSEHFDLRQKEIGSKFEDVKQWDVSNSISLERCSASDTNAWSMLTILVANVAG